MSEIVQKMTVLTAALDKNGVPHAFGGALALAWCTGSARGTIDIDLNIFLSTDESRRALESLPGGVSWKRKDLDTLTREAQIRLWWDATPVDIFLDSTPFHQEASSRIVWESLDGNRMPFLSCSDLAVFKVFFNRTRDWADVEEMDAAETLDIPMVQHEIARFLGDDDERIARLSEIAIKD